MIRNNIEKKDKKENYSVNKIPFHFDRNPKTMAAADRTPVGGHNVERLHLLNR